VDIVPAYGMERILTSCDQIGVIYDSRHPKVIVCEQALRMAREEHTGPGGRCQGEHLASSQSLRRDDMIHN